MIGSVVCYELAEMLSYKNIAGQAFTNSIRDIMQHVANHGTYHRGQIISMLRQVGYTKLFDTDTSPSAESSETDKPIFIFKVFASTHHFDMNSMPNLKLATVNHSFAEKFKKTMVLRWICVC